MANIQHKSHDRTVATISERNAIQPRTPGMMVLVRDAIGDPYAGSGRAVYRWDEVQASWILMFKDNVETLTFTGESKTISQDRIQLSFVPANGQVWDVVVRDGLVVHQVEHSVAGSVVTIQPDTPGQFDGKQLSVRYAYGTMTQQLDLEIARVVGEAVGAFDKEAVGLGNVDNTSDLGKPISTAAQTALNAKQNTLVSGINIKTLNGESLLGAGNLELQLAADQPSAVAYTYDASGRVETTTETLPTGTRTTTVTYNEAGQVKTVTVTLGTSTRTTQYAYDQYGVLTGTTSTES